MADHRPDFKHSIEQLVFSGDLQQAIQTVYQYIEQGDLARPALLHLQTRVAALNKEIQAGTIAFQQANIARNEISRAFLEWLSAWQPGGGQSALEAAIERLHIDPEDEIHDYHLYNCNRNRQTKKFRKAFDTKKDESERFQFYFICADKDEKPDSLAKRLVLQIISEEIGKLDSRVHFTESNQIGRIPIEKLPKGTSLNKSIDCFKTYVQKRFSFAQTHTFEQFIEHGVPKLPYQYVAGIFDLDERDWDDPEDWDKTLGSEQAQYFQWMTERFRCPHPDIPYFLFFFVIYIENIHHEDKLKPNQKDILNELENLCQRTGSVLLRNLAPVDKGDIRNYLREIGVRDDHAAQAVVDALVRSLPEADRALYEQEALIKMTNVEPMQRMVFQKAKK